MRHLVGVIVLLAACTSARPGRFRDQPVVWRVDDTRAIPEPEEQPFYPLGHYLDGYLFGPLHDAVDPPDRVAARDTNALDEVPDSTWFENRIGGHRLTPAEVARGAGLAAPPTLPLAIVRAKHGGNPGLIVEDATKVRYLIKFDTSANPEQQTAGDVVVNRLFWAIGYHVPSDHVIYFRRGDLRIAIPAVTERDIDRILAQATRRGDEIRAIASAYLPGKPKGGWSPTGVRADDANDRIAHEHRRVLRGMRVFAAWLGHTDIRPDNSVDAYVEEDRRRFLRHYLVDFGEALGGHQSEHDTKEIGWEYGLDIRAQTLGLITFGLWVRDWERQEPTPWKSIGYFGAAHFDPEHWRERYPYAPFGHMDAADAYWAAKLVMRFDRALLAAAVDEAQFSEPAAAAYLIDTLLERRAKIGAAYLDKVTPFDELEVVGTALCGTDLAAMHGVAKPGVLVVHDREAMTTFTADAASRFCVPLSTDGAYHMLAVHIRRGARTTRTMQLHYMASAQPRILGVVR